MCRAWPQRNCVKSRRSLTNRAGPQSRARLCRHKPTAGAAPCTRLYGSPAATFIHPLDLLLNDPMVPRDAVSDDQREHPIMPPGRDPGGAGLAAYVVARSSSGTRARRTDPAT
jgi:hypothetical protein